jgi:hypothetical protein
LNIIEINNESGFSDNFLIGGANKLEALAYSNHPEYGSDYGPSAITYNCLGDLATYDSLVLFMDALTPELLLVNLKVVDLSGHLGVWEDYLDAINLADSLVYLLWQK